MQQPAHAAAAAAAQSRPSSLPPVCRPPYHTAKKREKNPLSVRRYLLDMRGDEVGEIMRVGGRLTCCRRPAPRTG